MARLAIPALVLLALAAAPRVARAEDGALRLAWRAPRGCPSADAVRTAALRGVPADARLAKLDVDAVVEPGARWRVTLRTRRDGVDLERRLEASSCAALADATAVVVALAMVPPGAAPEEPVPAAPPPAPAPTREVDSVQARPDSVQARPDTVQAQPDSVQARPDSVQAQPAAAAVAPARPRPVAARPDGVQAQPDGVQARPDGVQHALALGVSFASDASSLPGAAVGGAASLAWTPGRARVEIAGARFADQERRTPASQAGATFALTTAGARGCYALVQGAVELAPCAGVDVAFVAARGFGAATNYDASAQWTSVAGGALVRMPFASWAALRLQGEATAPITRPRFVVQNDGPVHSPSALGGRATAGVELLFL